MFVAFTGISYKYRQESLYVINWQLNQHWIAIEVLQAHLT